jgi:hypothetical protein
MRSAGAASFTPVAVAVFVTRFLRIVAIAHLQRTLKGTRQFELTGSQPDR